MNFQTFAIGERPVGESLIGEIRKSQKNRQHCGLLYFMNKKFPFETYSAKQSWSVRTEFISYKQRQNFTAWAPGHKIQELL